MNVSAPIIKALKAAQHLKWHRREKQMPPNDYDYKILVQFSDGYITISDGGTVWDDEQISKWKKLI